MAHLLLFFQTISQQLFEKVLLLLKKIFTFPHKYLKGKLQEKALQYIYWQATGLPAAPPLYSPGPILPYGESNACPAAGPVKPAGPWAYGGE